MDSKVSTYYFSTRDLVTVGVISALGGVLSTYVGYLGQLLNAAIGVPFGAGQFLSGLHVFWIILAAGLIKKPGVGTATGLLKGFVEFFTGSTHGLIIVIVSLIQGIIVDIGVTAIRQRDSLPFFCIIGGLSAASNVLIFQLFYFSGAPWIFILFLTILAFTSGIIFAGYFGHATTHLVLSSSILRIPNNDAPQSRSPSRWWRIGPYRLSAVIFLITIAFSASLYMVFIWQPVIDPFGCEVVGQVHQPYRFSYSVFANKEITVEAELIGSVTYIPSQNYTGIQLAVILKEARPSESATILQVISSDGYSVTFNLEEVLADAEIILTIEDGLRLVAKNYPGWYWVQKVVSLVIT